VLLALGSSSSSNRRSLLQQELSSASLAAAAETLAASGTGFHAVLPGSGAEGEPVTGTAAALQDMKQQIYAGSVAAPAGRVC
jgi:hypothetical protein